MKTRFTLLFISAALASANLTGNTTFSTTDQKDSFGSGPTLTTWEIPAVNYDITQSQFDTMLIVGYVSATLPEVPYGLTNVGDPDFTYTWAGTQYTFPIDPLALSWNGGTDILLTLQASGVVAGNTLFEVHFDGIGDSGMGNGIGLPGATVNIPFEIFYTDNADGAPEPSTWAMVGFVLVLGAWKLRRRTIEEHQ